MCDALENNELDQATQVERNAADRAREEALNRNRSVIDRLIPPRIVGQPPARR